MNDFAKLTAFARQDRELGNPSAQDLTKHRMHGLTMISALTGVCRKMSL